MIDFPREVRQGDKVSATEFNQVVRMLRRLWPVQGPGIKLSWTPAGTVISAEPGGRASAAPGSINYYGLPSVFEIVEDSQTCGVSTYRFANQYFEVSGVLYDLKSDYTFTLHSVADLYLAIVLSSVSDPQGYIEEYWTFEDMQADMADETKSVIPLYKFDSEGAVACDLRHIPRADMWTIGGIELPSGGAAS